MKRSSLQNRVNKFTQIFYNVSTSGRFYKHTTICIMMIIKVTPQLGASVAFLESSFTLLEVPFMMFIVQANTIVIYDCNVFTVQATGREPEATI